MQDKIKQLLKEHFIKIDENLLLADKIYFKTGKLTEEDKNLILDITHGDNYTKFISDILFYYKENELFSQSGIKNTLTKFYQSIKNYNKNVFPISGFDNIDKIKDIDAFAHAFNKRIEILDLMKNLPSIAIRNLKNEIKMPRDGFEMANYNNLLGYFIAHFGYIENKDEHIKNKIYQKMFKSGVTLNDLIDFVEEKKNLIGDFKVTRDEIMKVISDDDMRLVFKNKDIMVIRIESPDAIKKIGCNSLWCFTYGVGFEAAYRQWNSFSTNDMVYVIINFNESSDSPDFMNVLIKPIDFEPEDEEANDEKLYDLTNEPQINPLGYINGIIGINRAKKIFTFEYE